MASCFIDRDMMGTKGWSRGVALGWVYCGSADGGADGGFMFESNTPRCLMTSLNGSSVVEAGRLKRMA